MDFAAVSTHIILPHVPVVTTKTIVISNILVNMWIRKTNIMRMTSCYEEEDEVRSNRNSSFTAGNSTGSAYAGYSFSGRTYSYTSSVWYTTTG